MRVWSVLAGICLLLLAGFSVSAQNQAEAGRCNDNVPLIEPLQAGRVITETANNVREEPSVDADLQGDIPGQEIFFVLDEPVCADGYTWYRVYYREPDSGNDFRGWTAAAPADSDDVWIETVPEDERPLRPGGLQYRETEYLDGIDNATPVIGDKVRVSIGVETPLLNMRDEPDTSGAVIVELSDGAVLDVLAGPVESDDYRWWQLQTENGTAGWVADTFLADYQILYYPTLIPRCPYADTDGQRLLTLANLDKMRNGELQEGSRTGITSLLTMASDGSQRCRIAFILPGSGISDPQWTPDGQSVVYIHESANQSIGGAYNGNTYIYRVSADGLTLTELAPGRQYYNQVAVSPDGSDVFYSYWGNPDSIWRVSSNQPDNMRVFTGNVNQSLHVVDDRVYFRGGIEGVTYDEGGDYETNIVWMDRETLDVFSIDGDTDNLIPIPGSDDILYYEEVDDEHRLMRFLAAENRSVELSQVHTDGLNLIGLMPDERNYLLIAWNRLNPDESPGEYTYAYFIENVETGELRQVTPYRYEARARSPINISPDGRYLSTDTGVFNLDIGAFISLDNAGRRGTWRPLQIGD